jgi:hypothetical protein
MRQQKMSHTSEYSISFDKIMVFSGKVIFVVTVGEQIAAPGVIPGDLRLLPAALPYFFQLSYFIFVML